MWLKLKGLYPPELPGVNIDVDWSYRKAFPWLLRWVTPLGLALQKGFFAKCQRWLENMFTQIYRHHGPYGILARTWRTGNMAIWTTILLATYLLVYFLSH